MSSISDISLRYNMRRNALPSFQKVEALLDSKNLSQEAALLAPDFLQPSRNSSDFKNLKEYFDHEYSRQKAEMMHWLPAHSFSYQYLALYHDIRRLHDFYLKYFEKKESYTKEQLYAVVDHLMILKAEKEAIMTVNARIDVAASSFEFFAQLDQVYFQALKNASSGAGEFVRLFVGVKIDSFNLMTLYRLERMSKQHLNNRFLVENPYGISISSLLMQPLQELVQKRFGFTGLTDYEDLEKRLMIRELQFLGKSIFYGLGEEVVLLCTEMMACFFYDLKLIAIAQELSSEKQEIKNHLINYDLHL